MRWYTLKIGDNEFKLSPNNPIAPRITFNLNYYYNSFYSEPNVVTLYNVDTKWFNEAKNFIGKRIQLSAGLTTNKNLANLLLDSAVKRVVPSYSNRIASFNFYCESVTDMVEGEEVELNISTNEDIIEKSIVVLSKLYPSLTFRGESKVISQNKSSITKKIKNGREVLQFLNKFGVYCNSTPQGYILTKGDSSTIFLRPSLTDFITQPAYINEAEIEMTLGLSGNYAVGNRIQISNNFIQSPGISYLGGVAGIETTKLLTQGEFIVTAVEHKGDSHSPSASAWVTNITAYDNYNWSTLR